MRPGMKEAEEGSCWPRWELLAEDCCTQDRGGSYWPRWELLAEVGAVGRGLLHTGPRWELLAEVGTVGRGGSCSPPVAQVYPRGSRGYPHLDEGRYVTSGLAEACLLLVVVKSWPRWNATVVSFFL
ncbi:unnamed protein product, partial [Cuscuta europaea]